MKILFLGPDCPPIREFLSQKGHTLCEQENPVTRVWLEYNQFDFGISFRYKHILNKPEIQWFSGRLINLHISYLPWNRGADPNLWSFLTKTPSGVSIHLIDEGIDSGAVLLREEFEYDVANDTLRTTYSRLNSHILELFFLNYYAILTSKILPLPLQEKGSFHNSKDKEPYMHLLEKHGWDTPIVEIIGKGLKEK